MTRKYENLFTLDGRVKPTLGVTPTKVKAVKSLMEGHLQGDFRASATLTEALTTSDAMFNFAHLTNLNFIPNYDDQPRNWQAIATTRQVRDFKPVTLFSLNRSWTNDADGGDPSVLDKTNVEYGAAPIIPEGTAYPYAYISGEVSQGAGVVKRGFKTDWTLEARINDGLETLDRLPGEMTEVSMDTEEADVWGALTSQVGAASTLQGGLVPGGATVPVNAAFGRDALTRAIIELSERRINGKKIGTIGGYNLLVPTGQGIFVQFVLNQVFAEVQDGSFVLNININGYNPLAGVSVVESDWVVDTEWYLMPKPGTTRRPVLDRLTLRGYENPALIVDNHVGVFSGSATVSPFEGSFSADVITMKLRQFGGGVLWDDGLAVVHSTGLGV